MTYSLKSAGDNEKERNLISMLKIDDEHFDDHLQDFEGELSVDVYQTESSLVIVAPVAGVEVEDLDISVNDSEVLTIKAKRNVCREVKENDYLTRECFWGAFARSIVLPEGLDTDAIKATFKRGVLKVEIPKINKGKNKKVHIN